MATAEFRQVRMTRCECERRCFEEIADCAKTCPGIYFDELCERAQCGRVCTACHCDLKDYLEERALPVVLDESGRNERAA